MQRMVFTIGTCILINKIRMVKTRKILYSFREEKIVSVLEVGKLTLLSWITSEYNCKGRYTLPSINKYPPCFFHHF